MLTMTQATPPANERTQSNARGDFVQRGKEAIARSIQAGDWIPAEVVIAKLEARLTAARERMKPPPG